MIKTTVCLLLRRHPRHELLLGRKKRGFGMGKYGGFGGKIMPGESIRAAGVRELTEESGITTTEVDLQPAATITFLFPARPEWDIQVYAFLVHTWEGSPVESDEMQPAWFPVDAVPYGEMWDDAHCWLPRVLAGDRLKARFIYNDDNETVAEALIEEWDGDGL